MSILNEQALKAMGFAAVGAGAKVSSKASFYGCERISIGDHARIDDFCVVSAGSGGIRIGRHVHIATHVTLIGDACITIEDFAGVSGHACVYSSTDDFTGASMTGPTVPIEARAVESAPVFLGEHVIVGAGTVILPGATLETGVAVGALSVVKGRLEEFTIYAGNPLRRVRARERKLLEVLASMREQGLLK